LKEFLINCLRVVSLTPFSTQAAGDAAVLIIHPSKHPHFLTFTEVQIRLAVCNHKVKSHFQAKISLRRNPVELDQVICIFLRLSP